MGIQFKYSWYKWSSVKIVPEYTCWIKEFSTDSYCFILEWCKHDEVSGYNGEMDKAEANPLFSIEGTTVPISDHHLKTILTSENIFH